MQSNCHNNDQESVLPLSELDKALKGIAGSDKTEVDAEAKKEQRRKAKGRKREDCPDDAGQSE